ncbi:MAG: hypothetical protein JO329_16540 [Planctomycetaceae bacterium]|nr:hypothetical protein [Planctomycetaceae bacterium]
MATTNANELEAHLQRALLSADRLFLALEEIEAAGGLATALAGRRPGSRDEVLARLRSARDQLDAALGPGDPRRAENGYGGRVLQPMAREEDIGG